MPPSPGKPRRGLLRVLGVWEGAAVGIGVAIGAGIFRTPGYVAGFLPSAGMVLAAWTIGGILVLGDSLILAELATRMPRAGGWYVYIEKGWGRFPAFLYGWTYMLVVDPASSAALVVVLGEYLASLLGLGPKPGVGLAIGTTLALFALALAGIRFGGRLQDALTYTKLAALVAIAVIALLLPRPAPPAGAGADGIGAQHEGDGDRTPPPLSAPAALGESAGPANAKPEDTTAGEPAATGVRAAAVGPDIDSVRQPEPAGASRVELSGRPSEANSVGSGKGEGGGTALVSILGGLLALGLALQGVLWTFEGYSNTTTLTEESVNPSRTLPRALVAGALALGATYLLVNGAYLHALGRDGLAASTLPAADLSARLFGGAGTAAFLLLAIVTALGSLNGAALSAPRVAYALARSGLAPEPLVQVTRLGTPVFATLWFAVAWSLYAWFGSFEGLVSVSIFIGALANVAVTATIFTHRRRDAGHRPEGVFLSPFYPWLPLAMLVLWSAFAAGVLYTLGRNVGYGLVATALAAIVYALGRPRRRAAAPGDEPAA